jgi:molybdopterin synthase catalytic subunit
MVEKKKKLVFIEGPITPAFISESIEKHSTKTEIGAHSLFLGQVRADEKSGQKVVAIEYTHYPEMAERVMHEIREETFSKFDLTCMHIYHSLGVVKSGEISLFVFTSSPHRNAAVDACSFVVEEIKKKSPVWGKEILEDQTYIWKSNN